MNRLLVLLTIALPGLGVAGSGAAPLPVHLRDTGLYATGSATRVRADHLPFTPQYPLWSDGALKRRWLHLPAGSKIDASRPDAWVFPPGTKLWKEFSFAGRRIETRYIERRADGTWRYATYVWDEAGDDAQLARAEGVRALPVPGAPGGRYDIPAQADCLACHEGAAAPVLGVGALQLSPDRDPLAVHGSPPDPTDLDLRALAERGWLRGLPPALLAQPPRIAADTSIERAALGYLHGNCGHCHHGGDAAAPVRLRLAQGAASAGASRDEVLASIVDAPSRFRGPTAPEDARVVVPGHPEAGLLGLRMRSRVASVQMPPLGTRLPDAEGLALIERWIASLPSPTPTTTSKESSP